MISEESGKGDSGIEMKTAILFLVFNRPDTTQAVFNVIKSARPPRLYVACDGARLSHDKESELVTRVQEIATAIDWPCEVHTLFRDENLGCRRAVSGALDWFFSYEEYGIILEDDCVVDDSFFLYAENLLGRYAEDERIMAICAMHARGKGKTNQDKYSYFFSRYNHCWGWASWRRAWQHYDHEMSLWPELRETSWLRNIGNNSLPFEYYWRDVFDRAYAGEIDSWAYRWTFSCWAQHGLAILPSANLVKNIGFGEGATHTTNTQDVTAGFELDSIDFPLRHPIALVRNFDEDRWEDKFIFRITGFNMIKTMIKNLPGGGCMAIIYRAIKRIMRGAHSQF